MQVVLMAPWYWCVHDTLVNPISNSMKINSICRFVHPCYPTMLISGRYCFIHDLITLGIREKQLYVWRKHINYRVGGVI